MVASTLTVHAYQELLDRGWRRSGTYLYLTFPDRNCCPTYTIRLHAPSFQPSAAQKKSLRRFAQFLSGEWAAKQQRAHPQPQQIGALNSSQDTEQQHGCEAAGAKAGDSTDGVHQQALPLQSASPVGIHATDNAAAQGSTAPIACTSDEDLEADMLRAVAEALTAHCNSTFFAAATLQSAGAPVAVQSILESSDDVMFTVKWTSCDSEATRPAEVAMEARDADANAMQGGSKQTVHLQSSLCWKAAAKYKAACAAAPLGQPAGMQSAGDSAVEPASVIGGGLAVATGGDQPGAAVSKKKAKKARKIAAKAAAAAVPSASAPSLPSASKKSVSCIAQELADTTMKTLTQALEGDTLLQALAPVATSVHGHMHVTLQLPSVSQLQESDDEVAVELQNILESSRASSTTAVLQNDRAEPSGPVTGADEQETRGVASNAAGSSKRSEESPAHRMLIFSGDARLWIR
jgi:hypothetical protein